MFKLPLFSWVGNAAAALCGKHGDVTRQAQDQGCSRQRVYDHAAKVEKAISEPHPPGPPREQLLQEVAHLRQKRDELGAVLLRSVDSPEDKKKHFPPTASAM